MDVTSTTQSSAGASQIASTMREGATALNADFQTFLEMLTVQAQNQDPLNPIDSTEYASQLASFSSVEQQVKTNDLLKALTEKINASNVSELSNWVGMDVRSAGETYFDGQSQTLHPSFEKFATEAQLVAYDRAGNEVLRVNVAPERESLEFDGRREDGTRLPAGIYRYSVESFAEDRMLGSNPVASYQRVTEAQVNDGSVTLRLEGGVQIETSYVTALRS